MNLEAIAYLLQLQDKMPVDFMEWAVWQDNVQITIFLCRFCIIVLIVVSAGWAMQCAGFLFLQRDWKKDRDWISQSLKYFAQMGTQPQV